MNPWKLIREVGDSLARSAEHLAVAAAHAVPDRPAAAALAALGVCLNTLSAAAQEAAELKDGRDLDDCADVLRDHLAGNARPALLPPKTPSLVPGSN